MQDIRSLINQHPHWYHQIEVAPGIITPGGHNSQQQLALMDAEVGLPRDCSGLRVLDLGIRDGFFSFEMEKRGASEVIGIDYVAPDKTGFKIASSLLESKVKYITDNVYNISREKYGTFDIVFFLGILYHLRNPMFVLDRLREVVNPNGLIFIETQIATDKTVLQSTTPTWQYFKADSLNKDGSNKWAPNMAALKAMAEDCQFEVLITKPYFDRGYLKGKAINDEKAELYKKADYSIGLWG